jgi:ubiquinone/menaquinone biosynthesis C-methylase UbiE
MENWVQEQVRRNSTAFDAAMLAINAEEAAYTRDPERYFERVCVGCNYLDAARQVKWDEVLKPGARVLDLGGGTGWLTAYLSGMAQVSQIRIVDLSSGYLETNLPVAVRRLNGDAAKISPAVGYFSPLLFEDASLDVVVMSSAIHHADQLEGVLREINRVLVPGGWCCLLNEVPVGDLFYLRTMLVTFTRSLLSTLTRRYQPSSASLSASGILYDAQLGDRMYPKWYWNAAIRNAGFTLVRRIDTGLPPVKGDSGLCLAHFICRKASTH